MKIALGLTLFIALCYGCHTGAQPHPRTLQMNNDTTATSIQYVKYFYDDEPDETLRIVGTKREVYPNGTFCLLNYTHEEPVNYTFKQCFDASGRPTGSGTAQKYQDAHEDRIEISFREVDTSIYMDTKVLANPAQLWFWKTTPKLMDTVYVKGIRKNFITKSIDINTSYYIYLGQEEVSISDRLFKTHKVKYAGVGQAKDTYDERWYSHDGLLIKEKHHVGANGTRIGLLYDSKS